MIVEMETAVVRIREIAFICAFRMDSVVAVKQKKSMRKLINTNVTAL
jgi:hypothetical protein